MLWFIVVADNRHPWVDVLVRHQLSICIARDQHTGQVMVIRNRLLSSTSFHHISWATVHKRGWSPWSMLGIVWAEVFPNWSNGSSATKERYHPSPSIIIHVELTWFMNCKHRQYPVGVFRGKLLPPVVCAWAMVGVDTHDQNQHPYSSLIKDDQLSSYIRSHPKMVTLHRPCASVRTQYRLA